MLIKHIFLILDKWLDGFIIGWIKGSLCEIQLIKIRVHRQTVHDCRTHLLISNFYQVWISIQNAFVQVDLDILYKTLAKKHKEQHEQI